MADVANKIAAYLNIIMDGDAQAWRTHLPAGFMNDAPTLVVSIDAARSHMTNALRGVEFSIRVYGGSNKLSDTTLLAEQVVDELNAGSSTALGFLRFGDLSWQELPPEPVTGWPSCRITGRVRAT